MSNLPEYIDGLPNISGAEKEVEGAIAAAAGSPVFLADSRIDFGRIKSAFATEGRRWASFPIIRKTGDRRPSVPGESAVMARLEMRLSQTRASMRSCSSAPDMSRGIWRSSTTRSPTCSPHGIAATPCRPALRPFATFSSLEYPLRAC